MSAIPLVYNWRSVIQRPVSTAMTAGGIALVVAVFVAMLALANGFRAALASTGSPVNALVLRRGANAEMNSGIGRDAVRLLQASPHVATDAQGRPVLSAETYVVINIPPRVGDGTANVVARGVGDQVLAVRPSVHLVEGRMFRSGRNEVVVGTKVTDKFAGSAVGDTLHFASRDWAVVGRFTADGSAFESEVWGENEQFMPVFRGEVFQTIVFRLADPAGFAEAKRALEADRQLTIDVLNEREFYTSQSAMLGDLLSYLALMVTSIMAVGAIFGAINTMFAAVSSRTPEIAVLLTLGYKPRNVLLSFLAESAIIAFIGGVAGSLLALPINGITTSTTNWASFSDLGFAFRVTPGLLLSGVIFAVVMGVVGGFFPARRAAMMPVVQALR